MAGSGGSCRWAAKHDRLQSVLNGTPSTARERFMRAQRVTTPLCLTDPFDVFSADVVAPARMRVPDHLFDAEPRIGLASGDAWTLLTA